MLATTQGMGRSRCVGESMAHVAEGTGQKVPTQHGRSLRRRNVHSSEKRGEFVGKTKRGKGTKLMVVADGHGVPLAVNLASASPHEVTLIEPTLERIRIPRAGGGRPRKKPRRLIYDMAADSDPLRKRLARRGIELICPNRCNKRSKSQDGRKLRRYKRRWKIERTISWIGNFRRLVVRYERLPKMYMAFVHLACVLITFRQF